MAFLLGVIGMGTMSQNHELRAKLAGPVLISGFQHLTSRILIDTETSSA